MKKRILFLKKQISEQVLLVKIIGRQESYGKALYFQCRERKIKSLLGLYFGFFEVPTPNLIGYSFTGNKHLLRITEELAALTKHENSYS